MSNNDIDIDTPDELDGGDGGSSKPSLKDAWESSPMLKVIAVVVGLGLLFGGYMMFFYAPEDETKAMIKAGSGSDTAKQVPGKDELDPIYKKELEEKNKREAEMAAQSGGSALPTPINTSKGGLDMPSMPEKPKSDPLAEWRKVAETRRMNIERAAVDEEGGGPPPEAVPMAQPIRPQAVAKRDPKDAERLMAQMHAIVGAQAPLLPKITIMTKKDSLYVEQQKALAEQKLKQKAVEEKAKSASAAASGGASGASTLEADVIVPAGTIAYGQLLTELNSDIKGPALVQILSGPFAGGRAMGKIEVKEEYMVITFNRVVKDAVTYGVEAIAMDEATTLTGQATDVDHHYFLRIILPAAAKFIEGYGSAVAEVGTTTTQTAGGGQATETPKPDTKESVYKGLEESSKKVSELLDKGAERPITVKIAKGTTMGVLFMNSVTTQDAGK